MEKVPYYAVGLNTINVAPKMIMVNGVICARSFKDFYEWFVKNQLEVTRFRNWPFQFGICSDIQTREISYPAQRGQGIN